MHKSAIAGAIASCFVLQAMAVEVGIASFNLAWAGTESDFQKHVSVCTATVEKWCDARAKVAKGATEPTAQAREKAEKCQADFIAAAGGPEQALQVAPCNAYKLNAKKWAAGPATMYQQKVEGLASTINTLVTEHQVSVIAFQEVKSEETLRTILGTYASSFEVCVAPHNAFQTVGFAWKKTLGSGVCTHQPSLAINEDPKDPNSLKKLRPGLELSLSIENQKLSLLNVHLKSGCANLHSDPIFKGNLLTSEDAACKVLNRQVQPLEAWIEDVAKRSPLFVVLGDFNRKLDEEARENVAPKKVRKDGILPSEPNTTNAEGSVASQYLWQEISDGHPSLVQVPLSTAATGCTGFSGLDHILLSADLDALQKSKPTSSKLLVHTQQKQVIATSDHCPRVTKIGL